MAFQCVNRCYHLIIFLFFLHGTWWCACKHSELPCNVSFLLITQFLALLSALFFAVCSLLLCRVKTGSDSSNSKKGPANTVSVDEKEENENISKPGWNVSPATFERNPFSYFRKTGGGAQKVAQKDKKGAEYFKIHNKRTKLEILR